MVWTGWFYPHKVDIQNVTAGGGLGGGLGPVAEDVPAEVKDRVEVVRTADGSEAVSSSQVSVGLSTDVRLGAFVTTWKGTASELRSEVLALERHENGAPLDEFVLLYLK